jgi:hypothetical protein
MERMQHIELLRRINYRHGATSRLQRILKLLNEKKFQYLLIGGYAVGYHGYPRATNDMDIWIAINQKTAEQMVLVVNMFGVDQY